MMSVALHGDARTLPLDDASVDAIVCDPPYGLSFMGKDWDHGVPGVPFWQEALRVLKPGGHLLAFGGTRTFHRLTVAIEDAGFEIRDCVMWLYGSGFPKSHDVSKAIDRQRDDRDEILQVTRWVAAARDAAGLDNAFIDAAFGFNGMAGHWTSQRSQPAVPTIEQVPELFDLLGVEPPPEIARLLWELNSRKGQPGPNWWKREKVGERTTGIGTGMGPTPIIGDTENRDITAPATPEAQAWDGWGTALKPAWEPIVVARKPVSGTVAQNVLAFGTGGLNIDGCRIDASLEDMASQLRANTPSSFRYVDTDSVAYSQMVATGRDHDPTKGRWPANLALDEHAARMLDAQSRFFYVAKASRGEREAGLREAGLREAEAFADGLSRDMNTANSGNPIPRARNHHPTVKPVELMRWLVRLVTPPGGLVLDPFMGSGSTGCAAVLEGFRFVGLDIDPEYVRIAKARIAQWIIKRDLPEPAVQTFTNKDHRQLSMFGEEAKS